MRGILFDMTDENPDHIEDLKKKLFSRNEKLVPKKKPGILHEKTYQASRDWAVQNVVRPTANTVTKTLSRPASLFKKIFLGSLAFLVLAVAFAFFVFEGGSNSVSADNIEISILGNTFTGGGEELALQVSIANGNPVALEYADLVIEYPKGAGDVVLASDMVRLRETLGTVAGGKSVTKNIKVTLFGEEGTKKDIKATLEYRVKGSNAIFTKEKKYAVTISSAPLALTVEAPTEIAANQEMTLALKVRSNATKPVTNVAIKASYPPGFQFKVADPEPADGNNVWLLGDIAPGMEKTIVVTGTIYGENEEERSIRFEAGELDPDDDSEIAVVYSSILHTTKIARSFVEARLSLNGSTQNTVSSLSGQSVSGTIEVTNNSAVRVENVEIRAKLAGSAFDKTRVTTQNGFYNSGTSEVNWTRNTNAGLAALEPGESQTLSFTLVPKPLFSTATRTLIENPEVTVEVSLRGSQTVEGSATNQIDSAEKKTVRISSDLQMAAQGVYRAGPFANTGPIPPIAEQATTYTIVWTVNTSANSVSQAEARTTLPLYVAWTGSISPSTENIFYNSETREVVWRLGQVARGTGYTGSSREGAFQVKLVPSSSQAGTSPSLIGETRLTAVDNFTGAALSARKGQLTTDLASDPGFPTNGGVVQ